MTWLRAVQNVVTTQHMLFIEPHSLLKCHMVLVAYYIRPFTLTFFITLKTVFKVVRRQAVANS